MDVMNGSGRQERQDLQSRGPMMPFLAGAPDHVGLLEAEARKTKTWIMTESLLVP